MAVLYIADDVVGPHLELLRLICEPVSQSRPHVTVRYFDRLEMPPAYRTTTIDHIDLLEPASFNDDYTRLRRNKPVFIRCASDELTPLEHKPHFPSSEFHITIYDGPSASFGRRVLRILRRVPWRFRLPLPVGTTLRSLPLKPRHPRRRLDLRIAPRVAALFDQIAGHKLTSSLLRGLTESERLYFIGRVAAHFRRSTQQFERLGSPRRRRERKSRPKPMRTAVSDVHLTPPELARDIADLAVGLLESTVPIHFGDPAVGTGAFYSALLQVVDRSRIRSALGFDVNPSQVAASSARWSHRGLLVEAGDYLHLEKLPPRNLILANPPYLRHQRIPAAYKHALRTRASIRIGFPINARAGVYVYFMLLSHDWMSEDAVAAWLVPAEFMQTDYGDAVRWYLTHRVRLLRIHQFDKDSPQFENAKVLPAVIVFRNALAPADCDVEVTSGGTLVAPKRRQLIALDVMRRERRWSVPMRSARLATDTDVRIRDLFLVKRGIATGANEFFVMTRSEAAERGIPKTALRPILPKVKTLTSSVVEGDADGYPSGVPQLCVLDCAESEEVIAKRFPRLMAYLEEGKEKGLLKRNLVRARRPWYRQERREPAPFLCTYMGRGKDGGPPIRFVLNRSQAVATNTYLMLYPRPRLAVLLNKRPELAARLLQLLQRAARETMSEEWRVHAGGLHKVEPGDLLDVRLPVTPNWLRLTLQQDLPLDDRHVSLDEVPPSLLETGATSTRRIG